MGTLEIEAHVLYRALKSLAPVPKTFEVREITESTDTLTGRTTKKNKRHKYAVVLVRFEKYELPVDYYDFRDVLKTLGQDTIRIYSDRGQYLGVDYKTGTLTLLPLEATSDVVINLETLTVKHKET